MKKLKYDIFLIYYNHLGAPNASGILSIVYLWLCRYITGTPGIFLILRFKSLSQVATMKQRCCLTRFTIQSSAYVPL